LNNGFTTTLDYNNIKVRKYSHKRSAEIIGLTDLPIEPLCYTEEEFKGMIRSNNTFIAEVMKEGIMIKTTLRGLQRFPVIH
jgi:hypothetical protein